MTLLEAIARMEGFYSEGSRPQRNNNPGDLEYHPWMAHHGGTLEDGPHPRFAKFPTPADGFDAMRALLGGSLYRGLTVTEAIAKFAPSNENNTEAYAQHVCEWTGLEPESVIDTHL